MRKVLKKVDFFLNLCYNINMNKIDFNQDKFKFYVKYLVLPNKRKEFKERLTSTYLAISINPDLAQEAKELLIKDYPFVEEFLP